MAKIDVKAIRTALGMTQAQLAAEIGVAQGDVSKWENDKYAPSRAARRALEKLLAERSKDGAAA